MGAIEWKEKKQNEVHREINFDFELNKSEAMKLCDKFNADGVHWILQAHRDNMSISYQKRNRLFIQVITYNQHNQFFRDHVRETFKNANIIISNQKTLKQSNLFGLD